MSIERLSGGLTPADGSDPRTFPEIFNGFADEFEDKNLPAFSAVAPTDGQVPVFDAVEGVFVPGEGGGGGLPSNAFAFVGTVTFESNGTFEKADFPFLRAIRVRCQGAGGGGGGQTASTTGTGSGGSAGAYGEGFITDVAGLASSVSVTVGSGGAGSTFNDPAGGDNGGSSSFGALVTASGGDGASVNGIPGVVRGAGGTELDFEVEGGAGAPGALGLHFPGGFGASSFFGGGGGGARAFTGTSTQSAGSNAAQYGGGGGGASHTSNDANDRAGGNGSDGIVIVELFA